MEHDSCLAKIVSSEIYFVISWLDFKPTMIFKPSQAYFSELIWSIS